MRKLARFTPLITRARRRLGHSTDYTASASRSWVISPQEGATSPAALFDPDDIARITGVGPDDDLDDQLRRAYGGPVVHGATVAYELHDAVLSRGHLFTRQVQYPLAPRRLPLIARGVKREFTDAVLASSTYGLKYFGHWMADDLPRLLAARDLGRPVSVLTNPLPAQREYLNILGLEADAVEDAYFERIVLIDDAGQNAHKRARFRRLRELAAAHAGPSTSPGVMLLRGRTGSRRLLVNEDEVAEIARRRGFEVFDPALTDMPTLMRACVGAKVVLGVEGSHLTNGMMWMADAGTVLAIQPPDRFVMVLKDWCDCIGSRYAFVVGRPRGDGAFHADTGAVERMLDRVS